MNCIKGMMLIFSFLVFFMGQPSFAESLTRSFAWPLKVQQLDPHNTSSDTLFSLIAHYLAPLVEINPSDNSIIPALAETWTISEGGKGLTLHLRKDAYWSDGSRITAQQVKQSIERALSGEMKSDAQTLLLPIKGAQSRLDGKAGTPLGVEALGEHTIIFKLAYRYPDFIRALAFPIASPVPMHQIGPDAAYPAVEQLSSSGPYRLVTLGKHSAGFITNEKYFGERPYFETVKFIFGEYRALIKSFLSASTDTLEYIPVDQMPWLKENMSESVNISSYNGAFYLVFKHEDIGGFSPVLRQLLGESLDYYRLNNMMTRQYFATLSRLIPWGPVLPADTKESAQHRSDAVEKVKQLMSKRGYSQKSPMHICISLPKVAANKRLFNLLRSHLNRMYFRLSNWDDIRETFLADLISASKPEDLCPMVITGYNSRIKSEEGIILAFFPGGLFYPYLSNQSELNSQYTAMNQLTNIAQRTIAVKHMEDYLLEQGYVRALYKTGLISLVNQQKIGNYTKSKSLPSIPVSQHLRH